LIVNYGLKNRGVDVLFPVIENTSREIPLIVNIAKTNDKAISGQGTIDDYIYSYKKLESVADVININISCPNTGDGVLLCEDIDLLTRLLEELQKAFDVTKDKKPILLKLKPDLSLDQLTHIVMTVKRYPCVKGYIISNLSKNRALLKHTPAGEHEQYKGGISGEPIRDISTHMIRDVRRLAGNEYVIIGCGGVFTAQDAYEKLKAGANLIELITGLVYEGPSVLKQINSGLVDLLKKDGLSNVSEVKKYWK
jgi:dihydroorotate dehydrogenase